MNMRSVRCASAIAITLAMSAPFCSPAAAQQKAGSIVSGEILVGYSSGTTTGRQRGNAAVSLVGAVSGYEPRLNAARITLKPGVTIQGAIAKLAGQAGIRYVEPNHIVQACATPNDPDFSSLQYAPQRIQADLAWDIWKPRGTVVVAMIDTGVQSNHPDLAPVMFKNAAGAVIGWNTLNSTANANDDGGHGTHGAGIALGHINGAKGMAGVTGWNPSVANSDKFAKLMPVKALNAAGTGTDASIAAGITWAADNGANVICISSASPAPSTTMQNAIAYAWGKGCVIVAAAGNEQSDALQYPAAYPNVVSVAATDETDTLVFFSQYGSWVKCAAPGSNIYSTYKASAYSGMTGTSAAAPHVAAVAAAILSQNPTLNNAQVNALIVSQVDPVVPYQGQNIGTSGRINAYRALAAAGDGLPNLTVVSFNPATISNQSTSTGTVQIGGPSPAGGVSVALSSSNTAVVTVPATVLIPEGATSVTFTATGKLVNHDSTATVTASAAGKSVTADLQVRGSIVNRISVSPASVGSGSSFVGTIYLDAPAKTGGAVVELSHNSGGILDIPATVTVPAGATSADFDGWAGAVTRRTSCTIAAELNGGSASTTIMVNPLGLSTLTLSAASVLGGNPLTGTVTLTAPAPTGGTVVTLSSSLATAAKVPANVTVLAGKTSATFTVTTFSVTAAKAVTITASAGGISKSAALSVTPLLKTVAVAPTAVAGGVGATGTVTIAEAAPAAGVDILLTSSHAAASMPASVTIPAGAKTATFPVTTSPVAASTSVTITAAFGNAKVTTKLTVKPAAVSKVVFSPTSVTGGSSATGTVTLTGPAPSGGGIVKLTSGNSAVLVPASVTVAAGATTATFTAATNAVAADTVVTVSAAFGGATVSGKLTVKAPLISSLALNPTTVVALSGSTGTVTLTGPAPAGGKVVTLKSSSTSAIVPVSITIPAGARSGTFDIQTTSILAKLTATLSAVTGTTTKTAVLTITL